MFYRYIVIVTPIFHHSVYGWLPAHFAFNDLMKINYCDRVYWMFRRRNLLYDDDDYDRHADCKATKMGKWTIRDRPNTVNIKSSSTMLCHMPNHFKLNYMIQKKRRKTHFIYDHYTHMNNCFYFATRHSAFDQNTQSNVRIFHFYHFIETNR